MSPEKKQMLTHWAQVTGVIIALLTSATAYVVSESYGGESFWKYLAGVALSVCGVLALLLYNDMRREQLSTRAEVKELNRELLQAELKQLQGRVLTDRGPVAQEVARDTARIVEIEAKLQRLQK
jgi:Na+/melibiose symporter-like transporter